MRIALCLNGQPRWVEKGYAYFSKNIIEPNIEKNEIDVFAHVWFDEEKIGEPCSSLIGTDPHKAHAKWEPDSISKIENLYRPKTIVVEKEFDRNLISNKAVFDTNSKSYETCSMLRSTQQVLQIKRNYEAIHGFEYDWVVRARFDLAINKKIDLSLLNPTTFYVPWTGIPNSNHYAMNCDSAFSNSSNMDLYSSAFENIETYVLKEGVDLYAESILFHHLYHNGFESPDAPFLGWSIKKERQTDTIKIDSSVIRGCQQWDPFNQGVGEYWVIRR